MNSWCWNVRSPGVPVVVEGTEPVSPEALAWLMGDVPVSPSPSQEGGTDG